MKNIYTDAKWRHTILYVYVGRVTAKAKKKKLFVSF